jgi:hypothetical protein
LLLALASIDSRMSLLYLCSLDEPGQIRAKLSYPNVFAYELLPLLAYLLLPQPAHLLLPLLFAHPLHSTAAQHLDSLTGTSIGDWNCSGLSSAVYKHFQDLPDYSSRHCRRRRAFVSSSHLQTQPTWDCCEERKRARPALSPPCPAHGTRYRGAERYSEGQRLSAEE